MPRTTKKISESRERIATSLEGLKIRCDELTLDPDNARLHPEASIEILIASLTHYGQKKPIVVQKDGMKVIAGNGTLEAARKMGWQWIAASVEDMTDEEARGYGLIDNKSAEASMWDYEVVSRLTILQATNGENITGWSLLELEAIRRSDIDDVIEGKFRYKIVKEDFLECPECGHLFPQTKKIPTLEK